MQKPELHLSEENLATLPEARGFRLRGTETTRLETFTDAAFAFATSMLVISIGSLPRDYQELISALKGAPAFAASFAAILSAITKPIPTISLASR